jgi:hypothetical protein
MKNWSALQATGATSYAAISWYFFLFFVSIHSSMNYTANLYILIAVVGYFP